ncbi:BlaI/MecI/CopY family transcriptional regulator [Marinilabilia sp.]|uniref:BlaI/MecI/CopY family transcriptional regulator n=1 Tax=Marinilabilia sp. TaxID=2021252 RepID=UPI0025B823E7|nr:BlaI/MecI/CopY family transcriptional regulator [Marinilabilia sp.]
MQLTKAEEQVMQIVWKLGEGAVRDIRESFEEPRPARNTVSTIVRILEKKGFVAHKTFGNVHVFFPLVKKAEYSKSQLFGVMKKYFDNSFPAMASFFAREKDLSIEELEELMNETRKELRRRQKN